MAETLHATVESLTVGERYLRRRLATDGGAATADLVLLVEAQELRLSIGELRVRRRASLAAELHRSLTRLRAGLDTTALLREVPRELGRLGYSRALMSGVRGTTWRATSAFAHQDESLAVALVQVGSSMPGRIGREQSETEAVRGRTAVLVRDAQAQPRVHPRTGDSGRHAGLRRGAGGRPRQRRRAAARPSQAEAVDEGDRDLLGLFADGVGLALERARYHERICRLRHQFELQISAIDELTHGLAGWDEPGGRPTPPSVPVGRPAERADPTRARGAAPPRRRRVLTAFGLTI
jgi:hypothetical protein